MALTLYTNQGNFRSNKILIAAKYAGITLDVPAFEFGKDNVTADFKAKNPLQKVPVLDTPQGAIFESHAILRYISRLSPAAGLCGLSAFDSGRVDQWLEFATNELEPSRSIWHYSLAGYLKTTDDVLSEAKKDVESSIAVLDAVLLKATYLVGEAITLADIVIFCSLQVLYATALPTATQKKYLNVLRWFNTVGNQPNVAAVVGSLVFFADKAEKAPAAEKPKPAPKPAADDYDDDEDKPKTKPKNPLDSLPPSSMDMDTTKKLAFSKRPFLPDFFEQLWPMFDANGYSWFTCHYKYNDENKVFFMTGNGVSGFLQRSDACRKYAFGVMNITGNPDEETPPFKVNGAWMFRGPGIIEEMTSENPDSEYYVWTRIDVSTPAGQAIIKTMFLGDDVDGEKVLERKYFK